MKTPVYIATVQIAVAANNDSEAADAINGALTEQLQANGFIIEWRYNNERATGELFRTQTDTEQFESGATTIQTEVYAELMRKGAWSIDADIETPQINFDLICSAPDPMTYNFEIADIIKMARDSKKISWHYRCQVKTFAQQYAGNPNATELEKEIVKAIEHYFPVEFEAATTDEDDQ